YHRAGAFAEYISVPLRVVYRLPDSLSFVEAAMLEALAVAVHAVSLAKSPDNSNALVVGAGMIGLLCAQVLRASGYPRVFLTDIDASRLKLAESLGANAVLSDGKNVASQISKLTRGGAVDVAIEAVGATETVTAAIESVRKGGTVVLVGNISPEVTLPLQKVVTRQICLQGSCASAGEYPRAMELLASGAVQVKPLITAIAPLADGPQWFERLHAREPNLMKVVLTPGESSWAAGSSISPDASPSSPVQAAASARFSRALLRTLVPILFSPAAITKVSSRLKMRSNRSAAAQSRWTTTFAISTALKKWPQPPKGSSANSTFFSKRGATPPATPPSFFPGEMETRPSIQPCAAVFLPRKPPRAECSPASTAASSTSAPSRALRDTLA